MERVTCDSGLTGWRARLRENYTTYEEWESYAETFGLCERLGYDDPLTAWEENPLIQGSTNPSDFRKADDATAEYHARVSDIDAARADEERDDAARERARRNGEG